MKFEVREHDEAVARASDGDELARSGGKGRFEVNGWVVGWLEGWGST